MQMVEAAMRQVGELKKRLRALSENGDVRPAAWEAGCAAGSVRDDLWATRLTK